MYLVNALNVIDEVKKAVIGKDSCVEMVMMAILARGHILIEDIPGVGKTTMALAFSRACAMSQNRVQFTPDVLPADITGFSIYRKDTGKFEYQPGAVMCNLLLADEINRTSPKTQSALLEVMEEGNVTVDGITREVPKPFIVMATQNPIGSSGTQMLPESQLDRFMICISMGYPDQTLYRYGAIARIPRNRDRYGHVIRPDSAGGRYQSYYRCFGYESGAHHHLSCNIQHQWDISEHSGSCTLSCNLLHRATEVNIMS